VSIARLVMGPPSSAEIGMALLGRLPKRSQRFAQPLVRAGYGYGYGDPGPVAKVPTCRRKHLNRTRLGTLGRGRGQRAGLGTGRRGRRSLRKSRGLAR